MVAAKDAELVAGLSWIELQKVGDVVMVDKGKEKENVMEKVENAVGEGKKCMAQYEKWHANGLQLEE